MLKIVRVREEDNMAQSPQTRVVVSAFLAFNILNILRIIFKYFFRAIQPLLTCRPFPAFPYILLERRSQRSPSDAFVCFCFVLFSLLPSLSLPMQESYFVVHTLVCASDLLLAAAHFIKADANDLFLKHKVRYPSLLFPFSLTHAHTHPSSLSPERRIRRRPRCGQGHEHVQLLRSHARRTLPP